MSYDLYVLNQRLPRFPLREGYADMHATRHSVDQAFQAWITEAIIGNLQRRKACSQLHDFAGWMEGEGLFLESVQPSDFSRYLEVMKAVALCRFSDFLVLSRKRLSELNWDPIQPIGKSI
jgi:hypothetical protein